MKRKNSALNVAFWGLPLFAVAFFFTACSAKDTGQKQEGLSVITTIFPPYDFVRAIAGISAADGVEAETNGKTKGVPGKTGIRLRMLLKPGMESHSYEPSPQDIIAIQGSDIFIYGGGESDMWVKRILYSMDTERKHIISLLDCVETVEEEIVEGMEGADGGEPAPDSHVWTAPHNAKRIVERICRALSEADPANAEYYRLNTAAYLAELDALDAEFRSIVNGAARRTLIFADRFPFRYFTDAYGLDYHAAFPGCSAETEPSAATVAFLVNKVRQEAIPVILYIEFSNSRMADTIKEATGAQKRLFHSAHNVSRDELASGRRYTEIMRRNAEVLQEALR